MTFGIAFILLMLALGGFAAYQGDRVGMAVGKKRLSIFGLRPKYTSRVITVLTGIIIVMITMAGVLLISHTARQSLFGLEDLQQQISSLSVQLADLQEQQRSLRQENTRLQEMNLALASQTETLQALNAALNEQKNILQAAIEELEQDYRDRLGKSYLVYDWVMQQPLVYTAGQLISSYVIDVPDSRDALEQEVRSMLEELNRQVLQDGAGEIDERPGWALVLEYTVYEEVGEERRERTVTEEERISKLVDAIRETPGLDSVVVQAFSLTHTIERFPVWPDFRLLVDRLIFPQGDVVAAHVFDGRESGRSLFNQLWGWLQIEVRQAALEAGVLERPDGTVTAPFEVGLLYDVVETIRSHGGPVTVQAIASRDVRTNDELPIGFHFEPVADELETDKQE